MQRSVKPPSKYGILIEVMIYSMFLFMLKMRLCWVRSQTLSPNIGLRFHRAIAGFEEEYFSTASHEDK